MLLHASCVSCRGRGLLILGPSGSGKSGLALELMAYGAMLVADDGVELRREADGSLVATAPEATRGLIEARGVGLLKARADPAATICLAVDLGAGEADRLPPWRSVELLGQPVPLLHKIASPHFAAAILQYLTEGRSA